MNEWANEWNHFRWLYVQRQKSTFIFPDFQSKVTLLVEILSADLSFHQLLKTLEFLHSPHFKYMLVLSTMYSIKHTIIRRKHFQIQMIPGCLSGYLGSVLIRPWPGAFDKHRHASIITTPCLRAGTTFCRNNYQTWEIL